LKPVMAGSNSQARAAWTLARRQHWLLTYDQLLSLGYTRHAIAHRAASGRLHRVRPRVFAVGRRPSDREAEWMAAFLSLGSHAGLSDDSAAALWRLRDERTTDIHVTLPPGIDRRQRGLIVHRRSLSPDDLTRRDGIRVTTPIRTLIDLATRIPSAELEAVINAADKLDLVDPETLRAALDERRGQQGVGIVRRLLDRRTFALTDSELERRFLPILRRAGLPPPLTQHWVNGFRVDFYWPELGLVVETDGLRYHRSPAQQARDRVRDQAHTAAGLTPLRFTHTQVRYGPEHVEATLRAVGQRLSRQLSLGISSRPQAA
jgi:very-short-patch-repair endonuclease